MAWKNHTAHLITTQAKDLADYEYMFNHKISRQSNKWVNPQEKDYGYSKSTYTGSERAGTTNFLTRYWMGARQPTLSFGTDSNSRFAFSQLYEPMKVQNKFYEGQTSNSVATQNLITTCNQPIYNLDNRLNDGFAIDTSTTADISANNSFQIEIDANENAGNDAIFYQTKRWDLEEDTIILAPEMTKHEPMEWIVDQAEPLLNNAISDYISGKSFHYCYPVDVNFEDRFFCFNQDCRANTFETYYSDQNRMPNTIVDQETIALEGGRLYGWNVQNDGTTDPGDLYSNMSSITDPGSGGNSFRNFQEKYKLRTGQKSLSTHGWGMMPGSESFVNFRTSGKNPDTQPTYGTQTFQGGTNCPHPQLIYDSTSGVSLGSFLYWNKENWNGSLWYYMGFEYEDLNITPYIGCTQVRNSTQNFLANLPKDNDLYKSTTLLSKSRPLTTNGQLTTEGFVPNTTNKVGQLNNIPIHPRINFMLTSGIAGQQQTSNYVYNLVGNDTKQQQIDISNTTINQGTNWGCVNFQQSQGGASAVNGELTENSIYNLSNINSGDLFGSKVYSQQTPKKLEKPYYLISSDIIDDNYGFLNNCAIPGQQNVIAVISRQYGSGTEWSFSTDGLSATYLVKKRRVINSINIEIVDSDGVPAKTLEPFSALFFKITRGDPKQYIMDIGDDNTLLEERLDKAQEKEYEEEIDSMFPDL